MLLMNPIKDAGRAAEYFGQSDGGYYLDGKELRREWGGKAASAARPRPAGRSSSNCNGSSWASHPLTGEQLTAMLRRGSTCRAWDFTARLAQGRHGGDRGRRRTHHAAGVPGGQRSRWTTSSGMAMTRVRKGGKDADRVTGNMALADGRASRRAARQGGRQERLGPAPAFHRPQRHLGR